VTLRLERSEVERFRDLVSQRLGLRFEDEKLEFLTDVLRRRIEESNSGGFASYLEKLTCPASGSRELQPVTEELTVAETHFFRNHEQLKAFAQAALAECVRAPRSHGRLRILSAGCASGEEPYSLAILVRQELPALVPDWQAWQVTIRAIDVNAAMIRKAIRGRYTAWSLRGTPEDVRQRYFRGRGSEFELEESVRSMVSFEVRNLVEEDVEWWEPGAFDVVFCRNVLMYLAPEVARAVVARIARSLRPGGFLFLGHAETLRGLSQEFQLRHSHDAFYYQRGGARDTETIPVVSSLPMAVANGSRAVVPELPDSWMEVIGQASRRIQGLAVEAPREWPPPVPRARPEATRAAGPGGATASSRSCADPARGVPRGISERTPSASVTRGWDPGRALDLLRRERFAEALDLVRAVPVESGSDPDVQLLHAVLLTNSGALEEAEEVCRRILASDGLNAGARYLMALCREHAGDGGAAVEHDQAAIYLDPGFAMPHLHLGLLAKRAGDLASARHELGEALSVLAREDASRILLFGGGFSREGLVRFCARELRTCAEPA
jgi:chemotaxis protein methyltransferase CheR